MGLGDNYVFVSLDPESKLVPTFLVGRRSERNTNKFMLDLSQRLKNHVQLSADGFPPYVPAVERAFGSNVDFGQIIKKKTSSWFKHT